MSLAITIELSDDDLKYFADAMQSAQKESQNLSPQEITDAASKPAEPSHCRTDWTVASVAPYRARTWAGLR